MRIDDQKKISELGSRLLEVGEKNNKGSAVAEQGKSENDSISISKKSKDIETVRKIVDSYPDIRAEKVNQIKASVESGAYNIRGEVLAGSIIKQSLIDKVF